MSRRFPDGPACPVCFQEVQPSIPVIKAHNDKAGRHCPASGEPFRIALTSHIKPAKGTA